MKCSRPRVSFRPLVELLENRLQPGSMVVGQGYGFSLLADNLSILDQDSLDSQSLVSQSSSENSGPTQTRTLVDVHSDNRDIAVASVAAARSASSSRPTSNLVENVAASLTNDDLSNLSLTGSPHSVPLAAVATPTVPQTALQPSVPLGGSVPHSPIGVANPAPIAVDHGTISNRASPVQATAVTPTALSAPAIASIASAVHPISLQAAPLDFSIGVSGTSLNYNLLIGGPGQDGLNGVAVDSSGNIYVSGFFETSPGTTSVFLASLDPTATTVRWAETVNGPTGPTDIGQGIAVSPDGSTVYVTGSLSSTDPVTGTDLFAASLDSTSGTLLGSVAVSGGNGWGVTVDPAGNVYLAGSVNVNGGIALGTFALDPTLSTALYGYSIGDGSILISAQNSQSIAVNSDEASTPDTFITGKIQQGAGNNATLIFGFNGYSGTFIWGGNVFFFQNITAGDGGAGAVAYQGGNVFLAGNLYDSTPATPLNTDLLLAQFDAASGNQNYGFQWYVDNRVDGSRVGDWTANGMAVNPANEPIVTGAAVDPVGDAFSGPPTLGVDVHNTHFSSDGGSTQGPDGDPENRVGGSNTDVGNAVVLDPANPGNLIVVGKTQSFDFPASNPYNGGTSDGFLMSVRV